MNDLQIFNNEEFGEVRMIEIDGKPYFVATDVATALGSATPRALQGSRETRHPYI